jgi:hypothetical protein
MPAKPALKHDIDRLSTVEREFLLQAEKKYRSNANWFDFEDFAFGMRSPLFSRQRSHLDVLQHPLYLALKEMWLDLGVRQGLVSASKQQEEHGARRKAQRSRPAGQERNGAKKRDVETSHSSAHGRVSKSRG